MKEKKLEARIFTIADWQKEEQYLRKRHKEGWKFVRVSLPGRYVPVLSAIATGKLKGSWRNKTRERTTFVVLQKGE